jgi:hypothetical protein
MSTAREWIILETWPDGVVARRVGSRGIQYLAHRRKGERLVRTWPDVIAAQAAIQRLVRGARVVA